MPLLLLIKAGFYFLLALLVFTAVFRPSYTHPPEHYQVLRKHVRSTRASGRANVHNEQIFIAIALYDWKGERAGGPWAENILNLIDLLGPENTFLSIYENNSGVESAAALRSLRDRVKCDQELVYEDVDLSQFPTVTMPDGHNRTKRILYLSEVRNRALRPLDWLGSRKYDKVLFLNDIYFDPLDAAQLLFSTHMQHDGRTQYAVACALDFYSDSIKLYDVYAGRDLEGYSMGVPFYPFFSHAGKAQSRNDMLSQTDAVRVKSCWSGMAAFDAKYIQAQLREKPAEVKKIGYSNVDPSKPRKLIHPARFRAEPEIFFDACECCLLIADTIKLHNIANDVCEDTGVYVNPYIRVGYEPNVHRWAKLSRRFERLYSWPQYLANAIARMPTYNHHRHISEGEIFQEEVWIVQPGAPAGGRWEVRERTARNGMYCGVRAMQLLLETERTGDKNWEDTQLPPGRQFQ